MPVPTTSLGNEIKRITDGVIIVDHHWHLKYANQTAAQALKHKSPAEWTGQDFQQEFAGTEGKDIVEAGSRAIRDGTPVAVLSYSVCKDVPLEYRVYPSLGELVIVIAEIPKPAPDSTKLVKEITTLNIASQKLQKLLSPEQLSQEIIEVLESFLEYSYSAVLLIDEIDGETLMPFALSMQKKGEKFLQKDKQYVKSKGPRVGIGITGWVAQHGKSVRVGNVQEDPRYFSMRKDIRSELCVPLFLNDRVTGVVNVETTKENAYSEDDQLILETIAAQISVSIQNTQFYERLRQAFIERENMQNLIIQNEKVAALGRLTASIAHEINNPLQSIKGFLSLFRQEVNAKADKEKIERYSNIMEEEIDRIARLIRNMRDFYRHEATNTEFADVYALLDTVLTLTAKQCANYGIEVVAFLAKPAPLVTANADHIKQLFMNLVLNAIDAMKNGGSLLICTSILKSDQNLQESMVEIKFSDTGPGMSQEVLDHLFESFFTTKEHGSGLGLYISREIVKSYGGSLSVTSIVDNGTTFTVHLPVYLKGL